MLKLILILTFCCVTQFSLSAMAVEAQKTSQKTTAINKLSKLQKVTAAPAGSKMTRESSRCIDDPKFPQLKCSKRTPVRRSPEELMALKNKPKLKSNEYSLSYEANKTTVFATKNHEGLLLSQNCFKGKTPQCQAYTKSIQSTNTKPQDNMKSPYHNNFGAIHCELMGGKGLIAKTSTNDDSDFCKFEDGSMVSSWSAYYKTHPQSQTK